MKRRHELYYALLSGEHPLLPIAELEALLETRLDGSLIYSFDGVAIFRANKDPSQIVTLAGWIKEVGRVYALAEADDVGLNNIVSLFNKQQLLFNKVKVKKYRGYSCHINERKIKDLFQFLIDKHSNKTLRIFITEGVIVAGEILGTQDTKAFNSRRPGKRPFFKPGPLSPQLSRVLVNLSRIKPGATFLDPFCGTGGFVLEACLIGAGRCLCGDIAPEMVRGSIINLKYFKIYDRTIVFRHDSSRLPIADESIEAIATDPPYGRSTTTAKRKYEDLVRNFLEEAYRVLVPGGYVVYAGPHKKEPWRIGVEVGFSLIDRFHMYVHSTLIREVVVARK